VDGGGAGGHPGAAAAGGGRLHGGVAAAGRPAAAAGGRGQARQPQGAQSGRWAGQPSRQRECAAATAAIWKVEQYRTRRLHSCCQLCEWRWTSSRYSVVFGRTLASE
jgi:hypothetical protein